MFGGWKERDDKWYAFFPPSTYQPLICWYPKTWLLSVGWRKHGLISLYEVPGPMK